MKPADTEPISVAGTGQGEIVATLSNVTLTFDSYQTRALRGVSLHVRRGEVFGLIGGKGSGKSSVLNLLAGRFGPTEGKVRVFGRSPRWPAVKARIAHLPQNPGGERLPTGLFRWWRRMFSPPRRVTMAQALAQRSDLLILDSPFPDLPPAGKLELKQMLRDRARQGRTIIVSAQCLSEVMDLCDRLAVIYHGEIEAVGSLVELLALPEAVRFLAPVLPQVITNRLLHIIRDDLRGIGTQAEAAGTSSVAAGPNVSQLPMSGGESSRTGVVDKQLAELSKPAASTSRKHFPAATVNSINHELLKKLVKPQDAERSGNSNE